MDIDERHEADYIDNHSEDQNGSTPIHSRRSVTNDFYSPLFSQYTQEESENIDVMWDWNSPQSKPRIRKQKRIQTQHSPKLPIKRQPSNNQISVFDKLKENLETLRDQIVTEHIEADNEYLSSIACKVTKHHTDITSNSSVLEDVFDDSMDEQLIICSQDIEHTLNKNEKATSKEQPVQVAIRNSPLKKHIEISDTQNTEIITENNNYAQQIHPVNNSVNKSGIENIISKYLDTNENKIANDSLDYLLETLKDEDLSLQTKVPTNTTTEPTCSYTQNRQHCTVTTPVTVETKVDAAKCTPQEIEQKRKEALAKLETKKKQTACDNESPIKCSPEEIEKKRLQALAKLEAKKKQDIIEQNRREALKRLEISKKRRALQAQPSFPCKISNNCK